MRSKWLIVALVASIAVNLGLGGFLIGRMTMPWPVPATLDPSLGMFRVLRELPEPRREALRPLVHEHFRSLRGDLRRMRVAQQRINAALDTQPFDAEALADALTGFRQALMDSQQANHRVLVRIAGDMTPEERALLHEAMSRPHGHRPIRRDDGRRPDPRVDGRRPADPPGGDPAPR